MDHIFTNIRMNVWLTLVYTIISSSQYTTVGKSTMVMYYFFPSSNSKLWKLWMVSYFSYASSLNMLLALSTASNIWIVLWVRGASNKVKSFRECTGNSINSLLASQLDQINYTKKNKKNFNVKNILVQIFTSYI